MKPGDYFFYVSFLAPFLLGTLVGLVTKVLTGVTLHIRLVLVGPLDVGERHRF
jgi:hypothetical protein